MEELEDGEGKWDGRLFLGRGKGVGFEGVVLRSMDGLEGVLSGLGIEDVGLRGVATELEEGGGEGGAGGRMEILVCTHGSRDCRCSDRGVPLVEALREEVKRRGLVGKVAVSEVGHVGGHKWVLFCPPSFLHSRILLPVSRTQSSKSHLPMKQADLTRVNKADSPDTQPTPSSSHLLICSQTSPPPTPQRYSLTCSTVDRKIHRCGIIGGGGMA